MEWLVVGWGWDGMQNSGMGWNETHSIPSPSQSLGTRAIRDTKKHQERASQGSAYGANLPENSCLLEYKIITTSNDI